MTNPNVPSEEQLDNMEPDRNRAAVRENDEGVVIEINTIAGEAASETRAQTYTRAFGHYFVNPESEATEVLDEFFARFMGENSVLDSFQRTVGEAYEVSVSMDDSISETDYVFKRTTASRIKIPSHSSYVEDIDEFLSVVDSEVGGD